MHTAISCVVDFVSLRVCEEERDEQPGVQAVLLQPTAAADTPVFWSAGRMLRAQQGSEGCFGAN